MFQSNNLAFFKSFVIWTFIFAFWGTVFYLLGVQKYANPKILRAHEEMQQFLLSTKNEMIKENQK